MALPSSYLTSYKNVPAMLDAVKEAQAPDRFTVKFLQDLGFTSAADRLFIKMLKTLGLLRESGEPTEAYHEFLDPAQSGRILADGMRRAYVDIFQINKNAHNLNSNELKGKFKTISKGEYSDAVLGKMVNTFTAFAKHADFISEAPGPEIDSVGESDEEEPNGHTPKASTPPAAPKANARLVYDINIHLPATRDPAVYDAIFSSLSKHLDV